MDTGVMIGGMDDAGIASAIEGELELLRSEVRADPERLGALLDVDFVEIGASGRTWEREALIADLQTSPALDIVVEDMEARRIADQICLVTYVTVTDDRRVLRSSWWREMGANSRCFFHQGTVAPVSE